VRPKERRAGIWWKGGEARAKGSLSVKSARNKGKESQGRSRPDRMRNTPKLVGKEGSSQGIRPRWKGREFRNSASGAEGKACGGALGLW